jgi:hypothetical protein
VARPQHAERNIDNPGEDRRIAAVGPGLESWRAHAESDVNLGVFQKMRRPFLDFPSISDMIKLAANLGAK